MVTVPSSDAFLTHEILNTHHAIENGFGAGRTARHIDINRHYLVNTLKYAVTIEDATTAGTGAKGHDPAGFCHLQIDLLHHRSHFFCDRSHYHQQIALAW